MPFFFFFPTLTTSLQFVFHKDRLVKYSLSRNVIDLFPQFFPQFCCGVFRILFAILCSFRWGNHTGWGIFKKIENKYHFFSSLSPILHLTRLPAAIKTSFWGLFSLVTGFWPETHKIVICFQRQYQFITTSIKGWNLLLWWIPFHVVG